MCTAAYGVFLWGVVGSLRSERAKTWVISLSIILLGLISFSRIYFSVHYVSDVLVGLVLGVVWIVAWRRIAEGY